MDDKTKISKYASKKREVINNLIKHLSLEKNKSKFMKAINYWKGELKLSDEDIFNKYSNRQIDYIKFRLASNLVKLYDAKHKEDPELKGKLHPAFELFSSATISLSKTNIDLQGVAMIIGAKNLIALELISKYFDGAIDDIDGHYATEMLKIYSRVDDLVSAEERLKLQSFKILWRNSELLEGNEKQKRQEELRMIMRKNLFEIGTTRKNRLNKLEALRNS